MRDRERHTGGIRYSLWTDAGSVGASACATAQRTGAPRPRDGEGVGSELDK